MLTEKRLGEIAYALLKNSMPQEVFQLRELADDSVVKKQIGNLSQATGISKEELLEFKKHIGEEILREANKKLQAVTFQEK